MKIFLLVSYLLTAAAGYTLRYLNLSYLKKFGHTVPAGFEQVVDRDILRKTSSYTIENSRVGVIESLTETLLSIIVLFGGILGWYDRWIASLSGSFMIQGLLFLIIIVYAQTLIGIPFDLYRHFRIENRYGFNTMTVKLWITDLVKSLAVTTLMSGIVIVAALWMVRQSPEWWWLWVWGFFLIFGLFVMYISPYVIEPLFFKFEPLKSEGLEDRIKQLVQKTGLKVSRVFQVDASRRSRHSNAYFTGIGHVKRIVLFDTLIQQMSQEEILAVLAHEIGHWKKRHVLKKLILSEATALAGLYAAFLLAPWAGLPRLLGYEDLSFFGRIIVIGFLGSLALFPLTPLFNMLSRKDEREADWFAKDLTGNPSAMGSALIKLSRENLSNLHPHPLYAWFYYSHPPVIERLKNLEAPG